MSASVSEEDAQRRQLFSEYVKQVGGKLKKKEVRLKDVEAQEVAYAMDISDTNGKLGLEALLPWLMGNVWI